MSAPESSSGRRTNRRRRSPRVREVMHPKMVQYYEGLSGSRDAGRARQESVAAGLNAPRPVGPALHAAISEALANFALHFVPQIINEHDGTLIYAGGDDVLALLPTSTALACAVELRNKFRKDWDKDSEGRERLLMGSRATVSAGLAVVHYKEDLRFALEAARKAEKAAKNAGRDALQISVCRRSGEHATALCPWDFTTEPRGSKSVLEQWVEAFLGNGSTPGASDRWTYHLRDEAHTLRGLPLAAMKAEIARQISRAEENTRRVFQPDSLTAALESYRHLLLSDQRRPKDAKFIETFPTRDEQDRELNGRALESFITLCQTASFLARGRDE